MAKTLKDFLEGYLKVKSADEQKFIDKHVTVKNPDRNGNGDDVFKGTTKAVDRRKDRKGYNPGEDEKVYEALKGDQHKIDANKNGKLDAHDFKLLRGKKKVAEEAEELEELSKKTVATYAIKAKNQMGRDEYKAGVKMGERGGRGQDAMEKAYNKRADKRHKGLDMALNKLAKEEVEQIDELDQKLGGTLSRYINKTKDNPKREKGRNLAVIKRGGDAKYGTPEPKVKAVVREEEEQIDELDQKLGGTLSRYINKTKDNPKREKGRNLAVIKRGGDAKYGTPEPKVKAVVREEEEQIDELSKDTMLKYLSANKKSDAKAQAAGDHSKSVKRMRGTDVAVRKYTAKPGSKSVRVPATEEVELEEKLTAKTPMGKYIKDFQKSDAPQFKGKSQEKRRVMAIAAKLTAERGGKKLTKEERLADRLGDISKSHQRVIMSVFEKLNEDNKTKFMEACTTPEGIDQMLDFAIRHRGE